MARVNAKKIQSAQAMLSFSQFDVTQFEQAENNAPIHKLNANNFVRGSDVVEKKVPAIIPGFLLGGMQTNLVGTPGCGKTWLAAFYTALVSGGLTFLGKQITQGNVLYFCNEVDQWSLAKRIADNNGNLENVYFISKVETEDNKSTTGNKKSVASFSLPLHMNVLDQFIDGLSPSLIIFDTFLSFLSDKAIKSAELIETEVLNPIIEIARETGCAILMLSHLKGWSNKQNHGIEDIVDCPKQVWRKAQIGFLLQYDEVNNTFSLFNMKNNTGKKMEPLIFQLHETLNGRVKLHFPQYLMLETNIAEKNDTSKLVNDIIVLLYNRGCSNGIQIASPFRKSYGYDVVAMTVIKMLQDKLIKITRFGCYDLADNVREDIDLYKGKTVVSQANTFLLP